MREIKVNNMIEIKAEAEAKWDPLQAQSIKYIIRLFEATSRAAGGYSNSFYSNSDWADYFCK